MKRHADWRIVIGGPFSSSFEPRLTQRTDRNINETSPSSTDPSHSHQTRTLLISIIAAGCASASITPEQTAEPAKPARPQTVYVRNFAVVAEDVKQSHGTISQTERKFSSATQQQREIEIGDAAAQELSDQLAKDLQGLGFTVEKQNGEIPATGEVLFDRRAIHQCR